MFPSLYRESENLVPQIYFGGEEPPPYFTAGLSEGATAEEIARQILLIGGGAESSGWIDNDRIFFHLAGGRFQIDLSKEFIYLAAHDCPGRALPTAFMALRFLQEPCKRGLFVTNQQAVFLEKTAESDQLCKELDTIWGIWVELHGRKMLTKVSKRRRILPCLMKYYEELMVGVSAVEWEFWDAFCFNLLEEKLKLKVEIVSLQTKL